MLNILKCFLPDTNQNVDHEVSRSIFLDDQPGVNANVGTRELLPAADIPAVDEGEATPGEHLVEHHPERPDLNGAYRAG